jgi:PST family polysaccharide transporter
MAGRRDSESSAIHQGTWWALGMQAAAQLTSLVVFGILCRWIAPADFGVFNTALLLVTLPRMVAQSGWGLATVQLATASPRVLDRLFWWNLALSGLAAVASVALGWIGALVADAPRLLPVTAALAGTTVVAALASQHLALLERGLQIRRAAVSRWWAQTVAGAVAVGLAVADGSWLALIAQQYLEWTVLAVLAWRGATWRPAWPWRMPSVEGVDAADNAVRADNAAGVAGPAGAAGVDSRGDWRAALRFSGNATLANVVFYASQNADKLLLYLMLGGIVQGSANGFVGLYGVAFNFMMKPVLLVSTAMSSVMLPALARVANQPRIYQEQAARFYRLTAVILFPCGVGMALTADEIMRVLAGSKWEASGRLLAWLAPAVVVHGLYNITGSLLMACGRAAWLARAACVLGVVQLQGYVAGYWLGGMASGDAWGATQGVAASYSAVLALVLFVPYQWFAMRETGVSFAAVFRGLAWPLRNSLIMGVAVWFLRGQCLGWSGWLELPAFARLVTLTAAGAAIYFVLARRDLASVRQPFS